MKEQEDAGILKPVKSSRLNGKKPALYQSYHIITIPPDYKLYQEELLYQLDFNLNLEYYLKNYEGIIIYEGLYKQMKGIFEIDVFCDAYEAMIQKASKDGVVSLKELPDTKEGQNRSIGRKFMSSFSKKTQGDIRRILEQGKYIPQEILQMKDF